MNELAWVAPLKEAILILFMTMFTATVYHVYFGWDREQVREAARLPLEEE